MTEKPDSRGTGTESNGEILKIIITVDEIKGRNIRTDVLHKVVTL